MEARSLLGVRSVLTVGLVLLALLLAPPVPAAAQEGLNLTVDRTGSFDRDGAATISGAVSCGNASGIGFVEVVLRQQVGRVSTVTGSGVVIDLVCVPGETIDWTMRIPPTNGLFRGGPASASGRVVVDGPDGSLFTAETNANLQLRR